MRLDVSQQLKLQQQMKLSPRMIQAMEILQLPLMALQERIEQELSSNPVLELREGSGEPEDEQEALPQSRGDEPLVVGGKDQGADFERLADFGDAHAEELEWVDRPGRATAAAGERDAKLDALSNTPAPSESLADYLLGQWAFVDVPAPVRAAGQTIITNLDDDGYLRTPLEQLPRDAQPPFSVDDLRAALPLVQRLDPPGVAARDLRECLVIQLDAEAAAGHDVTLAKLLVRDFLRDIELNHIPQIAHRTGKTVEQVKAAIVCLGQLDPRPGRIVGSAPAQYIVPDAVVDVDEQGNLVVTMRDDGRPPLKLSPMYLRMAKSRLTEPQAREFIRRNLRSAEWLISAILQRRQTVRRVVEEVFQVQREFLERGPEALRPLPMTDVAVKVGVHVATISRAVAGKYVQTPRGIFPLRMFFSGGTTTAGGENVSWDAIKARMGELIEHEDKANPLNDDEIAAELSKLGITIARRTVAKYRGLLDIPPARQRKTF